MKLGLSLGLTSPQALAAAAGGGGGDDLAIISKTITLADCIALGDTVLGYISFDAALPAGAVPISLACRRSSADAITSSAGTPTGFEINMVVSGKFFNLVASMNLDEDATVEAAANPVVFSAPRAGADFPFQNETTYDVYVRVYGTNVKMDTLTAPTNIAEVSLVYATA